MAALTFLAAFSAFQTGGVPAGPDSAHIHRSIVEAQRAFEFTRRRLLPISTSGSGRCDEQVGRFCYWYDPEEPPPPQEPEGIRTERARFLLVMAEAGERIPGDRWILAQRVRYLVEHGASDSAIALAARCGEWWCEALQGFALHVQGKVAAAELAFDHALAGMPTTERCRWNNLAVALEPDDRKPYRELDCTQRDSANAMLFWRATPLFARAGNDTRTEWFARQVLIDALEGAITHHGMRLGPDHAEMLLRYGWATAYGRRPATRGPTEEIDVVGHEPKPAYPLLVPDERGRWPPVSERPRARFAPGFAHLIEPLANAQLARFRRGDSIVVVAGFSARHDTLFTDSTTATLAVSDGPEHDAQLTRGPAPAGRGSLLLNAPASSRQLVSLEVHDSNQKAWAVKRVQYGGAGPMSDLLLTASQPELAESIEAAAAAVWSGSRIPRGSTIGLYWESYDHGPGDSLVTVSLTVEAMKPGFVRRLGQSLGLGRKATPLRLSWLRRLSSDQAAILHAIDVDLSRLSPGAYLLVVDMEGGRRATRPFQIVPAEPIVAREPNTPPGR